MQFGYPKKYNSTWENFPSENNKNINRKSFLVITIAS